MQPYASHSARQYQDVATAARVLGASPHQLVSILFDELLLALAVADKALARGDRSMVEARRERASTLLHALDASLDFKAGGELATSLSRVYRESLKSIQRAGATDPAGFTRARDWIAEIAGAWNAIG